MKDIATSERRKLSHTIHSISVQKELLQHEIEGLREVMANQKKCRKRSKSLPLDQSEQYHGGAVF